MKKYLSVLIAFTLLGLISSAVMTKMHFKLATQGLAEKSFCHVGDVFDCDAALASRYSKIETPYGTVLNSELGTIFYTLIFAGLIYSLIKNSRATLSFMLAASTAALLYNIGMAYISLAKLGILCLMCGANYIATIALVLLLPKALGISYLQVPGFLTNYLTSLFKSETQFGAHVGISLAVLVVGLIFFRGLAPEVHAARIDIPPEQYAAAFKELPAKEISIQGRPVWGNPNAKVTLVEFSDFQCPFCRLAAFTLKPYLKEYRNDIQLIYLNYPLDNACNTKLDHPMHPVSCLAAKAGVCAHKQGKFWEYHDLVFENQKRLSRSTLLELADQAHLDKSSFEQCLTSEDAAKVVQDDLAQGEVMDVHGTPSLFLNGRPFKDWTNPNRLRTLLESEIKNPSAISPTVPVGTNP